MEKLIFRLAVAEEKHKRNFHGKRAFKFCLFSRLFFRCFLLFSRTKTIAQPTEVKMEAAMRTNLRRGRGFAAAEATPVPEAGSGVGCEEGTPRDRNGWRMDMGG